MTYSVMDTVPSVTSLKKDEDHSSHYRYEVQWQIHNIANDRLWCVLLEWRLENLSQLCHRIIEIARLELAALGQNLGLSSSHHDTVKGIDEGILQEEGS